MSRFVSLAGVVGFIGMGSIVGCADDPKPSKSGSGGTAGVSGSAGTSGKGGSAGSAGKGGSAGSAGKGGSAGSAGSGMSGNGGTGGAGMSGMGGTGGTGMGGTGISGMGGTMPVAGEGGEAGAEGGAGGESGGEGGLAGVAGESGMGGEPGIGGEAGMGGEPGMGGDTGAGGEPGMGGDTGAGGAPTAGAGGEPAMAGAAGTGGTSSNPPGNLLEGYSFETGVEGWNPRGATIAVSSEMAYEGTQSLKVTGRTAFWNGADYNITSVTVPGVSYTVTARVRYVAPVTTGTRINISREVVGTGTCGSQWDWVPGASSDAANDADWVTLSGTLTILDTCAITSIYLYIESVSDTASFYVDTVSMVQQ